MKKLIITEDEKKQILEKYSEVPILFLKKIFGKFVNNIVKNFSDDAIKNLDTLMKKVFSNEMNFFEKEGRLYIKSLNPDTPPIKVDDLNLWIDAVITGRVSPEKVLAVLPSNLADGRTEFRKPMGEFFRMRVKPKTLPIGELGKDFINLAKNSGWIEPLNVFAKGNHSGWKFHVYSTTLEDVAYLYEKVLPIVKKYDAGLKLAGGRNLEVLIGAQEGKGVTIYLPSSVVSKNQQRQFLKEIQKAIEDYKTTGSISGDDMITNNIGYRYELSQPINSAKGVTESEYRKLYQTNRGEYSVKGMRDLFEK